MIVRFTTRRPRPMFAGPLGGGGDSSGSLGGGYTKPSTTTAEQQFKAGLSSIYGTLRANTGLSMVTSSPDTLSTEAVYTKPPPVYTPPPAPPPPPPPTAPKSSLASEIGSVYQTFKAAVAPEPSASASLVQTYTKPAGGGGGSLFSSDAPAPPPPPPPPAPEPEPAFDPAGAASGASGGWSAPTRPQHVGPAIVPWTGDGGVAVNFGGAVEDGFAGLSKKQLMIAAVAVVAIWWLTRPQQQAAMAPAPVPPAPAPQAKRR